MMTRRPYQSSASLSPIATWQGCVHQGLGSFTRALPLEAKKSQIGLLDRAAIRFANPEGHP
ncbi:hypothetical protein LZC95_49675 [Pendulispora brunnea]|uniref:Uncharacterized protein n=1 Tax=Pendulispora brunnea TaxID=2905690 RepID=A0ABZ2K741_9BACT